MTVGELIANLQATEEMDKEVLIDVDGVRYTIENRLLGYENHVDVITDKRYTGNDFFNFDNLFNQPTEF
jgi:hypothetical protein